MDPSTTMCWKIFPAFADIISISSSMQVFFFQEWHPLAKEVKKLALKASSTFISFSMPKPFFVNVIDPLPKKMK